MGGFASDHWRPKAEQAFELRADPLDGESRGPRPEERLRICLARYIHEKCIMSSK